MARTPSMTAAQAEQILGPRGGLRITPDNRPTVRKWLSAHGFPALFVGALSAIEQQNAYNQTDGKGLDALRRKLAKIEDADIADDIAEHGQPNTPEELQAMQRRLGEPAEAVMGAIDDLLADRPQIAPAPAPANPKPVPAVVAPADAHGKTAMDLLRELILNGYTPGIDEAAVRSIVQEQMAGIAPRVLHIQYPDKPAIAIEGLVHPEFERALKYLRLGANVMLVGPAGCGKSHLAKQLSKAMDIHFAMLCGSAGASESEVKGWLLPVAGGAFEYAPSEFVKSYENGNTLICLDEMDAYDPNMLLSINVPLANGHMYIPQRRENPVVVRGPNVFFIGTMNTFGTGANPLYTARNGIDEATRDRFVFITVDYDKRLEESIGAAGGLNAAEMAGIWELRDKCREAQLRRVISTRAFQKAAVMKQAGDTWRQIRDRLLEGWSKDERAKVGA